jgi:hypothetical protein
MAAIVSGGLMKFLKASVVALVSLMTTTTCPADAASRGSGLSKERQRAGHWRLTVNDDRFSGVRRCALRSRNKRAIYIGNAVAFRLKYAGNVSNVQFRVDDGPSRSIRDLLPELARLRVVIDRVDGARAPLVYVPMAQLSAARTVWISTKFGARPHRFSLIGFGDVYSKAIALGCGDGAWATK